MKEKIILILFFILILTGHANAQETSEVSTSALIKDVFSITAGADSEKMDVAVDYSIEILKRNPWSIEAHNTITMLRLFNITKKVEKKYYQLKEKYFSTIDDLSTDTAEKLMLLSLWGSAIDVSSPEEAKNNLNRIIEILKKNKEIISDKKCSSLIIIMLLYDRENMLSYLNEFLEKYPDHPAIPIVELNKLTILNRKNPKKCIEEIENWQKKYANIISPLGWKLNVSGYTALLDCYFELNDMENLKKYVEILNDISPNFFKGFNARWLDYLDQTKIKKSNR